MKFEWDEDKNRSNIQLHGVSFDMASRIFEGFTLDRIDDRHDYDELREISIGMIDAIVLLVVVHTDRDNVCRLISARQADKRERKQYEKEVHTTFDA